MPAQTVPVDRHGDYVGHGGTRVYRATGSGAMSEVFDPAGEDPPFTANYELIAVRLHLDEEASTAENFTAKVDSESGATYDFQFIEWGMANEDNYGVTYKPLFPLSAKDKINFAWANSDGRTWGLEVIYRERGQ